ncbi:MAG: threonine/serine exporter family protein [Lentisphaerota bacterium]
MHQKDSSENLDTPLVDLLLSLGQIMLDNGATGHYANEAILKLNKYLKGPEVRIVINYASIIITTVEDRQFFTVLNKSKGLDMPNVSAISNINHFLSELPKLTQPPINKFEWIKEQIVSIANQHYYKYSLILGAIAGIAVSAIGFIFGANYADIAVMFIASLISFILNQKLIIHGINLSVATFFTVIVTGLIASAGACLIISPTPLVTVITPIIPMIPAFPFIIGCTDILQNNNMLGLGRICSAIATLFSIAIALVVVMLAVPRFDVNAVPAQLFSPALISIFIECLLFGVATAGIGILFNAPCRSLLLFAFGGGLACFIKDVCIIYFALPFASACFWGILVITIIAMKLEEYSITLNTPYLRAPAIPLVVIVSMTMFPGPLLIFGLDGLASIAKQTTATLSSDLIKETLLYFLKAAATILGILLGILLPLLMIKGDQSQKK